LLLSAVRAGYIDRQQRRRAPSSNGAAVRRSAANAGSVVLTAKVDEAEPELSMGWVDPWVGSGWVEIFQFLVGRVQLGPLIAKVLKIRKDYVNAFKSAAK